MRPESPADEHGTFPHNSAASGEGRAPSTTPLSYFLFNLTSYWRLSDFRTPHPLKVLFWSVVKVHELDHWAGTFAVPVAR